MISQLESNEIFIELCSTLRNARNIQPNPFSTAVQSIQYYHFAIPFFSAIRGRDIKVTIGTDTHHSLDNVCDIEDALKFIQRYCPENLGIPD